MEVLESENSTLAPAIVSSRSLVGLVPDWIVTTTIIFICVAIVIGIPGNSLVLAVLTRSQPKTSTDWFIIFIAMCDLISLAINEPMDIIRYQPKAWSKIGTAGLCKVHYYVMNVLFIDSNFLILCVGVDRYLKTCRPHGTYITPQRAFWVCIGITAGSLVCAIPNLFTSTASLSGTCRFDRDYLQLRVAFAMSLIIVIVISSIVLVMIYSRIAIVVKRRAFADTIRRETTRRILQGSEQDQIAFADVHGTADPAGQPAHLPRFRVSTEITPTNVSKLTEPSTNETRLNDEPANEIKSVDISVTNEMKLVDVSTNASTSSATNAETSDDRKRKTSVASYIRGYVQRKTSSRVHPGQPFSNVTEGQSAAPSPYHGIADEHTLRANKTTQMIFAISLLFIIATVIPTIMAPFLTETNLRTHAGGQALIFVSLRLYTINHFANPLLYMFMSSIFRKKTVVILKSCKPC